GKNAVRKIRKENKVPAVIYGQGEPQLIAVDYLSVKKALFTPESYIVKLEIDGNDTPVIVREAQYHPVYGQILHVDFMRVSEDKEIELELPVVLTGTSPGVMDGGKLVPLLRRLRVRGIPFNLPDNVEVDISGLELGKTIRVAEVEVEGLNITSPADAGIAGIEIPRAVKTGEGLEEGEEGEEVAGEE
ncbi:MAG: 50S ribosomal protein L25, partial [Bacteroidota bacterium]